MITDFLNCKCIFNNVYKLNENLFFFIKFSFPLRSEHELDVILNNNAKITFTFRYISPSIILLKLLYLEQYKM